MKTFPLVLLGIVLVGFGCAQESWNFPIELGFTKQQVVQLAGTPSPQSLDPNTAWYPESGISVDYDDYEKVEAINFKGNYGYPDWITSDKEVVNHIKVTMDFNDLKRILGNPDVVGAVEYSEQIFSWKRDGYTIHATIWADDYSENGIIYPKNSVAWLEIEKSL